MIGARDALVIAARRTPIARLDGALRTLDAQTLGAGVVRDLVAGLGAAADQIDDVIIATATGPGGNLARRIALDAGAPTCVPGLTIDRQCGGGLDAILLACRLVESGAGELYVAGGVESASTSPLRGLRSEDAGVRGRGFFPRQPFAGGGCDDPGMAQSAEAIADDRGIARARLDAYAAGSHARAHTSVVTGAFDAEIVACEADGATVARDSCTRGGLTEDRLARIGPVVRAGGTVTAGNSSQIADGAAAVVVASRRMSDRLGQGGMRHRDSAVAGVEPRLCGLGAIAAARRLLGRCPDLDLQALSAIAMTEAFAGQMVATIDDLHLDDDRVNPRGGAIGLGHPWGASGAVQVVRLLADLAPGGQGLALAAIAGGMGTAGWFEREAA